jgi:hypothetical protein
MPVVPLLCVVPPTLDVPPVCVAPPVLDVPPNALVPPVGSMPMVVVKPPVAELVPPVFAEPLCVDAYERPPDVVVVSYCCSANVSRLVRPQARAATTRLAMTQRAKDALEVFISTHETTNAAPTAARPIVAVPTRNDIANFAAKAGFCPLCAQMGRESMSD